MLLTNYVRTVHSGDYKAEVLIVRTEKTRDRYPPNTDGYQEIFHRIENVG